MSPTPEARRQRTRIWVGVTLIVAAFVVIAIGIQADMNQAEQRAEQERDRERQACFEAWGQQITETIENRLQATGAVERANASRDAAIDEILLVVIRLREVPPRADEADVDRTLDRYHQALTTLRKVRAEAEVTRQQNPYPDLDC